MISILKNLGKAVCHLKKLDETFSNQRNYSDPADYKAYNKNLEEFEKLANLKNVKDAIIKTGSHDNTNTRTELSFADELYHENERQMKLADIIEYMFFSRGIYFLFQGNQYKSERVTIYLKLILRYVNLLMIYDTISIDNQLRSALLNNLSSIIQNENGYNEILNWNNDVGIPNQDRNAPNYYFDRLLPKTAGGLWHEMLVYAFILKYDIGYIFPLLLTQKPISLKEKLSPPDLIILHHKTYQYYGIEIGNIKERQSGGFMAPSKIPVIPIDTLNARISDRCPTCKKWINICDKVIEDFSTSEPTIEPTNEIRCLVDCKLYSLEQKLNGDCPNMKFKTKSKVNKTKFYFCDDKHHHYKCVLNLDYRLKEEIKNHDKFPELQQYHKLLKTKNLTERNKVLHNNAYLR